MPTLEQNILKVIKIIQESPQNAISKWKQERDVQYFCNQFADIDYSQAQVISRNIKISNEIQQFLEQLCDGEYKQKEQVDAKIQQIWKNISTELQNRQEALKVPDNLQDSILKSVLQKRTQRKPQQFLEKSNLSSKIQKSNLKQVNIEKSKIQKPIEKSNAYKQKIEKTQIQKSNIEKPNIQKSNINKDNVNEDNNKFDTKKSNFKQQNIPQKKVQQSKLSVKLTDSTVMKENKKQEEPKKIQNQNKLNVPPNQQKDRNKSPFRKKPNQPPPIQQLKKLNQKDKQAQLPKQNQQVPKNQPKIPSPTLQLQSSQVVVVIKYLATQLNLQYIHRNYKLFNILKQFINKKLKQQVIHVPHPKLIIPVIDKEMREAKSVNCGNYYFDPFLNCVQFYIKRKDNKQFIKNFKVVGNLQIVQQKITDDKQWSKQARLLGTDKIQQLIKILSQKKHQSKQTQNKAIQLFKNGHSIYLISDLFEFQKQHYNQLKLKVTWAIQLQQIVERIRDQSAAQVGGIKKKIKKQKQQCIRDANAHKILRYVVYKTYGDQQLAKLSKIDRENLKKAIEIVKKQIINQQLLNKLSQWFYQFTDVPQNNQKPLKCENGLILFGPPGTGKTELTEALPNLIGFHLISLGLSAADFMKTHVGESSRMILDLVRRANLSPHLICSVGIDEVDGLVPDRKDKQQKNKGQGISMLLSVVGGNKDVPNLLFLTSTNHLKKIDQAIRRRLSGQFQVGRPNPQARKKVIQDDLPFITQDPDLLNFLIKVTSNFTGAALKRLNNLLMMKIRRKRIENLPLKLSKQEITAGTSQIAKQFSITLGMSTFPQIYSSKTNKKYLLTMKFLNKISNRFVIVNQHKQGFCISYASQFQKFDFEKGTNKLSKYYEVFQDIVGVENDKKENKAYLRFENWLKKCLPNNQNQIKFCDSINELNSVIQQKYIQQQKKPNLIIIYGIDIKNLVNQEHKNKTGSRFFNSKYKNLNIFYFLNQKSKKQQIYRTLKWNNQKQKPYSGRIMVQLNQQPRMAFQLNTGQQDSSKMAFRYFMKTQKQNSSNDIIPQLVQFFTQRQVSYILLIQYQLMLQNAAYEQQKMLQVIQQKMGEAINYDKVAVIINVDSLIVLNQSSSDSSMGRSTSYSISDQNIYRLLLNYMRQFNIMSKKIKKQDKPNQFSIQYTNLNQPKNQNNNQQKNNIQKVQQKQKWIAMIIKNPQLAKLIKKDIRWPKTPQQRKQQIQEQQMQKQKKCYRCKAVYTQAENRKQRKCTQHPGPLVNTVMKKIQEQLTVARARFQQMKYKRQNQQENKENKIQNLYLFSCCGKGVNQQGQCQYKHISQNQFETNKDEHYQERKQRKQEWEEAVLYL